MKQLVTALLLVAGLATPAIAIGGAEAAGAWSSQKRPSIAYEDGARQAAGYGRFYKYRSESGHSDSKQYDPRPGGDGVTVKTQFWRPECDVNGQKCSDFQADTQKQTPDTTSASWKFYFRARNLYLNKSAMRGTMRVCENQNWSPDPCSSRKIKTFSY